MHIPPFLIDKVFKKYLDYKFSSNQNQLKDTIPNDLKSCPIYKFTCASCSSSYIGGTCCHFKTRIEEHINKDNKSHIYTYTLVFNIYTPQ